MVFSKHKGRKRKGSGTHSICQPGNDKRFGSLDQQIYTSNKRRCNPYASHLGKLVLGQKISIYNHEEVTHKFP